MGQNTELNRSLISCECDSSLYLTPKRTRFSAALTGHCARIVLPLHHIIFYMLANQIACWSLLCSGLCKRMKAASITQFFISEL